MRVIQNQPVLLNGTIEIEVCGNGSFNVPFTDDFTLMNQHRLTAKGLNRSDVVADEKDRAPLACYFAHLSQTLFLKLKIANGQHFVDNQDFRLEMRRHCK